MKKFEYTSITSDYLWCEPQTHKTSIKIERVSMGLIERTEPIKEQFFSFFHSPKHIFDVGYSIHKPRKIRSDALEIEVMIRIPLGRRDDCSFQFEHKVFNKRDTSRRFEYTVWAIEDPEIAKSIVNYKELSKKEQIALISIDRDVIRFIETPTEETLAVYKMRYHL